MKKASIIVFLILFSILIISTGGILIASKLVFFPNTTIDCGEFVVDVNMRKGPEIAEEIKEKIKEIEFIIAETDGTEHHLKLGDYNQIIDTTEIANKIDSFKKGLSIKEYTFDIMPYIQVDAKKVENFIFDTNNSKGENKIEPEDAYIAYNEEKERFEIVPEKYGNIIKWDCQDVIVEEMNKLNKYINLDELNCYPDPDITSKNEKLFYNMNEYDDYNNYKLIYVFGNVAEALDVSIFHDWLEPIYEDDGYTLESSGSFSINEEKIREFVADLDYRYSTVGTVRDLSSTPGEIVTIANGNYGWLLDVETMVKEINDLLTLKISVNKEPVFSQVAECFGEKDFEDSYIEISIKDQHLWMYVDGEMIMDSPVVTGDVKKKLDTPIGIYKVTEKKRGEDLVCAEDGNNVSYWFPFNEEIGMHDAEWRENFGETIYEKNGSKGCVELPIATAKFIFENFEETMPIIIY